MYIKSKCYFSVSLSGICINFANSFKTIKMDIKRKIKECGFTISQVAALMTAKDGSKGISQPTLSSLIAGGNPTFNKLCEIADILGISVSELVSDCTSSSGTITCPNCGKPITLHPTCED